MSWVSRRWVGWFDGVDDYVIVNDSESLNPRKITFVAIFRFGMQDVSDIGFYPFIISKGRPEEKGYWIYISRYTGRVGIGTGNGVNRYEITSEYVLDGKIHVVAGIIDYDNKWMKLYIDGTKTYEYVLPEVPETSADDLYIGRAGLWLGDIYGTYIYNRALTDDEIAKLSEDPFDPSNVPRDGLVGWWDFNKADWENGILPDLSGNGNDGTMYGVAQKSVLVKRGAGELPEWDLRWEWDMDGIDDYVTVDVNGYAFKNAFSIFALAKIDEQGMYVTEVNEPYAGGIGRYDATEGAWVVDVGEKGYFFEKRIGNAKYGRGIWVFPEVKVSDNTITEPFLRIEIVDLGTGKIIACADATPTAYSTTEYISWKGDGFIRVFAPRESNYAVRLYSYGNLKYWVKRVVDDTAHMYLLSFNNQAGFLYLGKRNGTGIEFSLKDDNSVVSGYTTSYDLAYIGNWLVHMFGFDGRNQQFVYITDDEQGLRTGASTITSIREPTNVKIPEVPSAKITDRIFLWPFAMLVIYDRVLSESEYYTVNDKGWILDGLVHWWVVREDGYLVDLVTGKEYQIQGNPTIREIYDETGKFNSGTGVIVWDIIKDERGA